MRADAGRFARKPERGDEAEPKKRRARDKEQGRAANDAYWTPIRCAVACVAAVATELSRLGMEAPPARFLEPCVGGGGWIVGVRRAWPTTLVDRIDIEPNAPGMAFDLKPDERAYVANYRHLVIPQRRYTVTGGNPPYSGDLTGWFDLSLASSPVVFYLLRSTALGSQKRSSWWAAHPPAVIWTLVGRPHWGGPGARKETDQADSNLVLWVEGHTDTRHRWLRW